MPDIKLHEVVAVSCRYKEKEEGYWGNRSTYGVVIEISDQQVTIVRPDASTETFLFDDKEKTHSVHLYSELEYRKDIVKAIASAQQTLTRAEKNLKEVTEWLHDFDYSVSFLNRLLRFTSQYGFGKKS